MLGNNVSTKQWLIILILARPDILSVRHVHFTASDILVMQYSEFAMPALTAQRAYRRHLYQILHPIQ
jgi:hypothetical protein